MAPNDDFRQERVFTTHRGGRRGSGGGGPPFDEWFEKFRRFFEGGGGGNNPLQTAKTVGAAVIVILILIALYTSFYTVDVSEEGVITRFERYHTTTSPGLHFKLPFFIDRVTKVPSKVILQQEFGFRSSSQKDERTSYHKDAFSAESLMLTGDLNVADVEWIVQYRISDPWKFLFHARDVQKNIRDVSMSIMRRVVGDRLVGHVLTVGRVEIADEAKRLTQEVLDRYDLGINIVAVMLQDVNPPEAVKNAFNEVNAAKQEQEQAINIAERGYNSVIPEARGKAEQVIADAQAFAVGLVNRSKGDASKFRSMLTEYRKSPDVTRKRLYIETMEEVMTNLGKFVVVDSKVKGVLPLFSGGGNFLDTPAEEDKEKHD